MSPTTKASNNNTQFREFFYNKETPHYWKFLFFLLEKVFLKAILGAIVIALIITIPSVIQISTSYYAQSKEKEIIQKNLLEEKTAQRHKDESVFVKQLLKTLDNQEILESIQSIYNHVDSVHAKALANYKKEPNNRETSRPGNINENYKLLKKNLDEDFKNALKISTVLALNNEGASSQITLQEIQQTMEIIRKYKVTGHLKNNEYYMSLKSVADAIA